MIVDANGQQCDGAITSVGVIEPLAERVTAFGWDSREVDGHNLDALDKAMTDASEKPVLVIACTDPLHLVPLYAERAPLLHTLRFTSDADKARFQAAYQEMLETH